MFRSLPWLLCCTGGDVAYAAVLEGKVPFKRRIALLLSGGNLDLDSLRWQHQRA